MVDGRWPMAARGGGGGGHQDEDEDEQRKEEGLMGPSGRGRRHGAGGDMKGGQWGQRGQQWGQLGLSRGASWDEGGKGKDGEGEWMGRGTGWGGQRMGSCRLQKCRCDTGSGRLHTARAMAYAVHLCPAPLAVDSMGAAV